MSVLATFVETVEIRRASCPEEVAYCEGLIARDTLLAHAKRLEKSTDGKCLRAVADGTRRGRG